MTTDTSRQHSTLAAALANAFLSTDWQLPSLTEAGREALGIRAHWVRVLATEVLRTYPRAPRDRPRELRAAIAASTTLQRAAAQARRRARPLRVVHWASAPTRMAAAAPGVPVLHDQGALAAWLELSPGQLVWLADPGGRQRRAAPGPLHTYSYSWVARGSGVPRLLESPTPILKRVQRQLLHDLLERIPCHQAAQGFVPGRSVLSHARRHLGAQVVVTVDVADFFARISAGRLYALLRRSGYAEPVAHLLTGLCSTRTPGWVLQAMPPGGADDARAALRARLRSAHLPQGAPTSPMLANLVCFRLDRRLSGFAAAAGAVYSRYADDLTFSGDAQLAVATGPFVRGVQRIAREEGLPLNPRKTRVRGRGERQVVTGVVINERPNIARPDYDRLRAVLHDARQHGPDAANREAHPDFRAHLTGRVDWVESVNPGRGRRLRADLDAIVWPAEG